MVSGRDLTHLNSADRRCRFVKTTTGRSGILLSLLASVASSACFTGCQTTIGGQTLPSPNYLEDDVQYFPHGPEFKLTNQVEAMRKYQLEQDKLRNR